MIRLASSFFQNNIFYIVLGIILLFILFILVCLIVKLSLNLDKEKKLDKEEYNEIYDNIIEALKGLDNIKAVVAKGSRLNLILISYDVDLDKLKSLGINGIIKMTNKLTLVAGDDAEKLESYINTKKLPESK